MSICNKNTSLCNNKNVKNEFINKSNVYPIKKIEANIRIHLKNKYNNKKNLEYQYLGLIMQNLIFNKNTHLVSIFKDYMIIDYLEEFLKRFYKKNETYYKLPKISIFYQNYLKFFCTPTIRYFTINNLIHNRLEKKAEFFYNENYNKKKNKHSSSSKKEVKLYEDSSEQDEENEKQNIFFNDKVRKKIEKYSPINSSMALPQSGSKLKKDDSGLLITDSNEKSLVSLAFGLNNNNLYSGSNFNSKKNKTQTLDRKKNKRIIKNNISFMSNDNHNKKNNKKIYNNNHHILNKKNNDRNNNNGSSHYTKIEKKSATNTLKKIGMQNLKILLKDNIEKLKSKSNKKLIKKKGLWNLLNEKDAINKKEQDKININSNNLNIDKQSIMIVNNNNNKKTNLTYNTLYKNKSASKIKNKLSSNEENKKQYYSNNPNQNTINNLTNNSNYGTLENVMNKIKSNSNINLSKKNNNKNNNRNNKNKKLIDSIINKIKNNTFNSIKKKTFNKKKIILKKQNKINLTRNTNFNINKIDSFGLTTNYLYSNNSKKNIINNNVYKNNSHYEIRANSKIIKNHKKINSPSSIFDFIKMSKLHKTFKKNKNSHKSIDDKSNHIHNVNININNQINIGFSHIKEFNSFLGNNKKKKTKDKLISRNRNKSLDFNTINQNIIISNNNYKTFFSNNSRKKENMGVVKNIKLSGFKNKNAISRNNKIYYNIEGLITKNKDKKIKNNFNSLFNSLKSFNNNNK